MNAFRLGGAVVAVAFLAGFGSVASAQFPGGAVSAAMAGPSCGCPMPMILNPINLSVPTLSPLMLPASASVQSASVPPRAAAIPVRSAAVTAARR